MPRLDAPRWLPWLIILLIFPPRYQILPPRPINENFFYTSHKEILSPCDFWKKWWFPLKQSIFSIVLGLRNNSATWFMRFRYKSFAMDTWYLVSLVTHLNWPGFLENFSAPSSLQQSQMKSSANKRELKWPRLWQTTAEYLAK